MAPSASHLMPSTEIITTNTLIVTNLDPLVFLAGNFMKIKAKFEQYGSIYKLIPIKSFNLYDDETDKSKHHLNIPVLEKNRLDSPPGSPKTLVDDLGYKLVNINLNNSNSNGVNVVDTHNEDFSLDNNNGGADNSHKDDVPMIFVQDWDDSLSPSTSLSSPSLLSSITSTSRPSIIY
nr:6110_t:CDS:2 [Entrophospora candida]